MNVGFISLGCSKNLIDTEAAIGVFKKHNFKIVNEENQAQIIVINTCGFIDSAKEEAINTILEMTKYKNQNCRYIIVMGCLVQRYYDELKKALPEVDLFIKLDEYDNLWKKIDTLIDKKDKIQKLKDNKIKQYKENKNIKINKMPMLTQEEFLERTITTGVNYAYLKIGEGCSNMCTYCAIPYIRGPFVSRKKEDIIEEAQELVNKKNIKELIVIAQDTTKYGIDIYGKAQLPELLKELVKIKNLKWIRVLYSYPEGITQELIDVVAKNEKISKYFDIPIQHISNAVLKKMNRKTNKDNIKNLIINIRDRIPNVTLRTSLIVGFPGETKEDFNELLEFVKQTKFDKLGCFKYSKEDNTPAEKMPNQIHGNTKKLRYNKIMEIQQKISKEKMKEKIGNIYEVLIEEISYDKKYYIGRTMQDAPEIDGIVYIKNEKSNLINKFVNCKIINVKEYDLIGKILN